MQAGPGAIAAPPPMQAGPGAIAAPPPFSDYEATFARFFADILDAPPDERRAAPAQDVAPWRANAAIGAPPPPAGHGHGHIWLPLGAAAPRGRADDAAFAPWNPNLPPWRAPALPASLAPPARVAGKRGRDARLDRMRAKQLYAVLIKHLRWSGIAVPGAVERGVASQNADVRSNALAELCVIAAASVEGPPPPRQ